MADDGFDTTLASDESQSSPELPPAERYRIDGELGRGGLGRVLLAYDEVIGRHVAVKELIAGAGVQEERFLREARLTGRLEHPGIVPVYEIGRRSDGSAFYTMKVVRGETLQAKLDLAGSRSARLALLRHYLEVCHAVAYAHDHGVIHRDLKPANVMIGRFGETVVLDWGIAKRVRAHDTGGFDSGEVDPGLTRTGTAVGTPHYMSPEQVEARSDIDERCDVWSLGVILFQLLTGVLPFRGDTGSEIMLSVQRAPVPDPRSVDRSAPRELAAVCKRCLIRDRDARFPNAKALAVEIDRYLTGQLVEAYGYSTVYLGLRWLARKRALLGLSSIALVATLLIALAAVTRLVWPGPPDAAELTAGQYRAISMGAERARVDSLVTRPSDGRNAAPVIFDAIHRCTAGEGACDRYRWLESLDVRSWKRLAELEDPELWMKRSSVPEVDRLREAAMFGRYEMWGAVILPHPNIGVQRVPIPMFMDVVRLAWLGTIRAEIAERSGAVEDAEAWYADLILAADHLEGDAWIGITLAINMKIGIATRWADLRERYGRDARAQRAFVDEEMERRKLLGSFELGRTSTVELERIARDSAILPGVRAEALNAYAMRTCYGSVLAMMVGPTPDELPLLEDDLGHPLLRIVQLILVHDVARGFLGRIVKLSQLVVEIRGSEAS